MANAQIVAGRNAYDANISPEKWQSLFLKESFLRNIFMPLMGDAVNNVASSNNFITVLSNWRGDQSNVEMSIPMSSEISDITYKQITNITGTETGVLTTDQKLRWSYVHRSLGRDRITHVSDLFDMDREAVRLLMNYWDRFMSRTIVATLYSIILEDVFDQVSGSDEGKTPFVNNPDHSDNASSTAAYVPDDMLEHNADRIQVAGGTLLASSNDWSDVKSDLTTGATAKADHKLTVKALRKLRRALENPNERGHVQAAMVGTLMREPRYRVLMSRENSDVLEDELMTSGIMNYANRGSDAMFEGEAFDWKGFSFYSNPYLYPIATVKSEHSTVANRIMDLVFMAGNNAMMFAMKIPPTIQREVQQYTNVVGWNLLAAGGCKLTSVPSGALDERRLNMGILATRYQG